VGEDEEPMCTRVYSCFLFTLNQVRHGSRAGWHLTSLSVP
jgi:hypothetical protein